MVFRFFLWRDGKNSTETNDDPEPEMEETMANERPEASQKVWDAIHELRGSPDADPVIPFGLPGAGTRRSELTAHDAEHLAMVEEETMVDDSHEAWAAIDELRGSPDADPVIPLGLPGAGKRRSELTAREAKRLAMDEEVLDSYIAHLDYLRRKDELKRLGVWPRWPDGQTGREELELAMDDELKQLSQRVDQDAYDAAWLTAAESSPYDDGADCGTGRNPGRNSAFLEALRTELRRLLAER